MKYTEILKSLKAKEYAPIYFLMGDEAYYIDQIADYVANNVLTEVEKDFNQHVLYGKDVDVDTIISTARRYPMMASNQVVIIKEAQEINNIEALLPYVKQPLDSTVLVLCYKYKSLDKRKALAKQIAKQGVLFESQALRDYEIADWISKYIKSIGYSVNIATANLLGEYLGTDLSKIVNELSKLTISIEKGSEIDTDIIQRNIGISKDYNIFELTSAVGKRDILKCNRIINHYAANMKDNPIQRTISTLFGFYSKLLKTHLLPQMDNKKKAEQVGVHPYVFQKEYLPACKIYNPKKLVENISILREFDMKSKGSGNVSSSMADLQKEMIYRLLH